MDRAFNIFALKGISPGRSEVVALWDGAGWTTDPTRVKNYWSHSDAIAALDFLKDEGLHRSFDAVDIFDFEYREPSERKRWHPGRSLTGYSQQQSLKLINMVRSAIANLDMDDRNPAIRAALTIGWEEGEEAMSQPKAKKRWGEMAPGDAREILDAMGDQMAQMDSDDVSDVVTLGLMIVAQGVETVEKELPVPDHETLRQNAIDEFRKEKGREPKLGWWEDPLSTEHPAGLEGPREIYVDRQDQLLDVAQELYHELEDQMQIRLDQEGHGPVRDPVAEDVSMTFDRNDIEGMLGRRHKAVWATIGVGPWSGKKRWGFRVVWSIKYDPNEDPRWKEYQEQPFDTELIIREFIQELMKV